MQITTDYNEALLWAHRKTITVQSDGQKLQYKIYAAQWKDHVTADAEIISPAARHEAFPYVFSDLKKSESKVVDQINNQIIKRFQKHIDNLNNSQ